MKQMILTLLKAVRKPPTLPTLPATSYQGKPAASQTTCLANQITVFHKIQAPMKGISEQIIITILTAFSEIVL